MIDIVYISSSHLSTIPPIIKFGSICEQNEQGKKLDKQEHAELTGWGACIGHFCCCFFLFLFLKTLLIFFKLPSFQQIYNI